MLCEKLYKTSGVGYKELAGSSEEAEDIFCELIDLKKSVDARLKYAVRTIYRKLKIEYEQRV